MKSYRNMLKKQLFLHVNDMLSYMKRLLHISFLFVLLFFLSDCKKKDKQLIVSGTTYNQQLSLNISGMNVSLYAKKITSGTWNTQYSIISSQTTASDGSFYFKFDNVRASEFKLVFNKSGYFTDEYIFSPDALIQGVDYNNIYNVHLEAWIKLYFKNYPPTSTADIVSYRFLKGSATCPDGCNDSLKYLYGANIDTYHICKLYGSQNAVIEWNYSSNYSNLQHIDTVWIIPNDTTIHNISF